MVEKLTGVAGSMFAGKTDELIRLVTRAEYAGKKVQVFKSALDNRWGLNSVKSHSGSEHVAIPINEAVEMVKELRPSTEVVAIDEAQFFGDELIEVVDWLVEQDVEVVVAGLPTDFRGEPFGPMPILLAKADQIIRLTAICTYDENGEICGEEATRTQRFVDDKPAKWTDPVVVIGAEESYGARCPTHHVVINKPHGDIFIANE